MRVQSVGVLLVMGAVTLVLGCDSNPGAGHGGQAGLAGPGGGGGTSGGSAGAGGAPGGKGGQSGSAGGLAGMGGGPASVGGAGGGPIATCASMPAACDANAACTDSAMGFACACKAGFTGDGATCDDVDECATNNGDCDANATCTNTAGSHTCACRAGFTGDGTTCTEIDECATNNGGCNPNAVCSNIPGSHVCTCNSGFSGDGVTCTDIDECATATSGCAASEACVNTAGSFTCGACPTGYRGGTGNCVDIDECAAGTDICSANATCSNGAGTYGCACIAGFTGDGIVCNACKICRTGKYVSAACTATTNTVCTTCSTCPAGKFAAAACSGSSDTVCAACDAHCTACTGAGACTACAAGYVVKAGACIVAPRTCLSIHLADSTAPSGVYQVDLDGGTADNALSAYCDMATDGGGWMKILQYHDMPYTPSAAAVGNIAVPDTMAMAKMADSDVNNLRNLSVYREYRIQGDLTTKKLFIKSSATWDDTARGEGLALTPQLLECEATTNCSYQIVTSAQTTIDSNNGTPVLAANDGDRYFTDYNGNPECYTYQVPGRCYTAGADVSHPLIPNLSIWVRELPAASDGAMVYPMDETAGSEVHDISGDGLDGQAFMNATWTLGHTGNALVGGLLTYYGPPASTEATVSLWVRRDGMGSGYARILSWSGDALDLADASAADNLAVYTPDLGWKSTGQSFGAGFHHVAVTVGGGTIIVYVDGHQVYTNSTVANLSGQFALGSRADDYAETWNGALDQLRVYDRVLTPDEIAKLSRE